MTDGIGSPYQLKVSRVVSEYAILNVLTKPQTSTPAMDANSKPLEGTVVDIGSVAMSRVSSSIKSIRGVRERTALDEARVVLTVGI